MSENEILDKVAERLDQHQPTGYRVDVLRTGVRKEGDWWYVVVRPSKEDVKAYDYNRILQQAENELEDEDHLKVLLVPVLPD